MNGLFLDFQKHGKRKENELLFETETESFLKLYLPLVDHTKYNSDNRSVVVYDIARDEYAHVRFLEAMYNVILYESEK